MKKILIAGANSYIGLQFERWIAQHEGDFRTDTLDLTDDAWRRADFAVYDAVFMVAGIAHRRERAKDAPLYDRVNRDLPYEVAQRAKAAGVQQFVFMSSMSVYGNQRGAIDRNTLPAPISHYGRSKLAAEALLNELADASFCVAILRPPMVYGPGCRGNYPKLSRLARRLPLFPACHNRRSMLFIDHLCEAVRLIIDGGASGTFFPQDAQHFNTGELARLIARANGHALKLMPGFAWLTHALGRCPGPWRKVFGDLYYDMAASAHPEGYVRFTLEEAVVKTEREAKR